MKAIVIGSGRMAKGIVSVLAKAYPFEIGLFSRDIEKAKFTIEQLQVEAIAIPDEDKFSAEIIIHTLWYDDIMRFALTNLEPLKGKILVDITNPFNESFTDFVTDYNTSSAENIQRLIPETKVVGAFKNTYWVVFDNPEFGGIKSDIYVTSDDDISRLRVIDLLKPIPFRIFDAGRLINNRTIERMTLLEKELATKAGNHPRVSFHLWGVANDE